ncbi:transketolase [Butyricicoccus sp. Marseille-Q5471]|uniref:transketolase n=1 Tax=Butyricicoccus sp. Marseille-Q5471 TaxID=3039493 RepID=UPI0024BCCE84|nr:transketolase [Butyricicoccus sp. Marseille-Q5471]
MTDKKEVMRLQELAYQAKYDLCKLCGLYSGSIHMGGDMSMIDVLTCLFQHTMRVSPELAQNPERDRFILSKGHGAACMYVVMAQKGFFEYQEICDTYGKVGSKFGQHPCKTRLPMLDASTGSLGHGLPISVGLAASGRQRGQTHRVFCMMGDGETCEGSVWEAAMTGHALGLGNLVAVVDRNRQLMTSFSEGSIKLDPYADKWRAFGWNVIEIPDGNDMNQIVEALDKLPASSGSKPTAVIANTVKGKGISFMERQIKWHAGSLNETDLAIALSDLDAAMEKQRKEL